MTATVEPVAEWWRSPPLEQCEDAIEGASWMTLGDIIALLGCSMAEAELYYRVERLDPTWGPQWLPPQVCTRALERPVTPRHLRNLERLGLPCTGDGRSKRYPWPLVSDWLAVYREQLDGPRRQREAFIHPLDAWRQDQRQHGIRRAAEEAVYRVRKVKPWTGWKPEPPTSPLRNFIDPHLTTARRLAAEGLDVDTIKRKLLGTR